MIPHLATFLFLSVSACADFLMHLTMMSSSFPSSRHFSKLNFMHVIASGLSPVNDRITKIVNRIKELNDAVLKAKDFLDASHDDVIELSILEALLRQILSRYSCNYQSSRT